MSGAMAWLAADITLYIAAGVLLLSGVWLGWWSLFGDRARGRRRCPKCWYDLRGTPGMRCSECGFEAKRERQLHRARRRWRSAWLAAALLLVGVGYPIIRTHGWAWLLPNRVLIAASARHPGDMVLRNELDRRLFARAFSDGDMRALVLSSGMIRTRDRWPRGVNRAFELSSSTRPGVLAAMHFRGEPASFAQESFASGQPITVLGSPPGTGTGNWDILGTFLFVGGRMRDWKGAFSLHVGQAESVSDVMTPVRDAEVTGAIRAALCAYTFGESLDELASLTLRFDPGVGVPRDIAWPLVVELRNGDLVLASMRFWMLEPSVPMAGADAVIEAMQTLGHSRALPAVRSLNGCEFELPDDTAIRRALTLRVRSEDELALYCWDCEKYWSGEFEVPLIELMQRGSPEASPAAAR